MRCLLYTSDAADEEDSVDLGGRRIIKKNIKIVTRIVEQGIAEGLIRSENPNNMASLILSVLFTPQTKEILDDDEVVENKVNFIYDFIMNGISRKEQSDE